MPEKHTPGPWSLNWIEPYELHIRGPKGSISKIFMDDAPVREYNKEQEENAKLIAAAPDLLEALKYILNWEPKQWDVQKARDMANAAIQKAEGVV